MKFDVTYECRSSEGVFQCKFEFESDQHPTTTDTDVVESALRDSIKFMRKGLGGLEILDITPQKGWKMFNLFKSKKRIEQEQRINFFYKNCKKEIQDYIDKCPEPTREDILKIAVNAKLMYDLFSKVKSIQADARNFCHPLTTNGLAVFISIDNMEEYSALKEMQALIRKNFEQLIESNTSDLSLPAIDSAFIMSKLINFNETFSS